ncbi:MAG: tRNA (5-methylaminomethyl-2-thiouridine)(34)-methyltransferase MnmD [Bacteroidota bacterium]
MLKPELITTEDGSHSLYVPQLKETYHSFHGALQESQHVFIQKGLSDYSLVHQPNHIELLEVGFGTGLNALLTASWAVKNKIQIEMTSLEAYPLEQELALKLNYPKLVNDENGAAWFQLIHETEWDHSVRINSFFSLNKRNEKLQDVELPSLEFDIVFFDAFAPNKQPELWDKTILEKIYSAQNSEAYFVTYCAKGQLKRDLKELGFKVDTLDGPPGKKEMVRAVKPR